ncbi:ABC transporter permease [Williamsoniiplasma lucivorax]|uniref:Ribose/galactose ABC transporter permease n=1 Tax=Williamsoniiplasma lucivorax TaxID=209274 RepID=A0A2S5RDX8_9MOLU|nr:ABC transporter permease [Williamsoniiplasma lucivorax]PPE05507.1 ribose/galactose ABC transporter permease [Williamsoniiplasma lucivorax]
MKWKFKRHSWFITSKTKEVMFSSEASHKMKYLKGSIFAILAGFIISGLLISILNVNPFEYFFRMFDVAYSKLYFNESFNWMAFYIIGGLAMAVGFKSGVFNIGAPGQIIAATGMSTVVLFSIIPREQTQVDGGVVFLLFLVSVLFGALMAFIAGILKALFNIHEVVTTILLNWFVWYFFKWIFTSQFANQFGSNSLPGASMNIPSGLLAIGGNQVIAPLLIALGCVVIVGILFAKTTFGFKLKVVGSSPSVAKYSGINVKQKIVLSMVISGALVGVASFVLMTTLNPNIYFGNDNLPVYGFDIIAISLVAFNNPIGVIGVGWLWGIIQNAGAPISSLYGIPTQIAGLVSGIIIYFAAISAIFIMFNPIQLLKMSYYILKSKHEKKLLWLLYKKKTKALLRKKFLFFTKDYKAAIQESTTKFDKQIVRLDFKSLYDMEINHTNQAIKELKKTILDKNTIYGFDGITTRKNKSIKNTNKQVIKNIEQIKLALQTFKVDVKVRKYEQANWLNIQKKQAKKDFKKALKANKEFEEGQVGYLKGTFTYRDQMLSLKSEFAKQKLVLKELIQNLKSDASMKINIIKHDNNLNPSEKRSSIKTLRAELRLKLQDERKQINILQSEVNTQLQELKTQHQAQIAHLEMDKIQLETIHRKAQEAKIQIEKTYQEKLSSLSQQEIERKNQIDMKLSDQKIVEAKKVLLQLQNDLAQFNSESNEIYIDAFTLFDQAIVKMNQILTNETIEAYDAEEKMVDRIKLALKIRRLQYHWIACYEIFASKKANQLELAKYQQVMTNLDALKAQTKTEICALDTSKTKHNIEQLEALIIAENMIYQKLEGLISAEEAKYYEIKGAQ